MGVWDQASGKSSELTFQGCVRALETGNSPGTWTCAGGHTIVSLLVHLRTLPSLSQWPHFQPPHILTVFLPQPNFECTSSDPAQHRDMMTVTAHIDGDPHLSPSVSQSNKASGRLSSSPHKVKSPEARFFCRGKVMSFWSSIVGPASLGPQWGCQGQPTAGVSSFFPFPVVSSQLACASLWQAALAGLASLPVGKLPAAQLQMKGWNQGK